MKASKILVLFAALCLPAVCYASRSVSQFTSDVTLNCGDGCNGAPVAANSSDGFSLSLAKMLFHSGVEPTVTQVAGQWKLVGEANVPGEPDSTLSNAYDPNGLKNSDGSPSLSLSIQLGRETGQTNFSGRPYTTASVTILNMGRKTSDQGPNVLTLNNDAREACFAQYSYIGNSLADSHFNYECRLLDTDSQKMVCALSFYFDPSDDVMGKIDPADQAWSGRVWFYQAYVKE